MNKRNNSKRTTNAKNRKKYKIDTKAFVQLMRSETFRFMSGMFITLLSVFLFIALASFIVNGNADQSLIDADNNQTGENYKNWAGSAGANIANTLINNWIGLAAFIFTLWTAYVGLYLMRVIEKGFVKVTTTCILLSIIISLTFGFIHELSSSGSFIAWGGSHGNTLSSTLFHFIGPWGTALVIIILIVILLVMISRSTIDYIRDLLKNIKLYKKQSKEAPAVAVPLKVEEDEKPATTVGDDPDYDNNINTPVTPISPAIDTSDTDQAGDTFVFVTGQESITTPENNQKTDNKESELKPSTDTPSAVSGNIEVIPGNIEIIPDNNGHAAQQTDAANTNNAQGGFILVPAAGNNANQGEDDINTSQEPANLSQEGEPTFTVTTGVQEELVEEVMQDYDPTLDLPRYNKPSLDLLADMTDNTNVVDRNELETNKKRIIDTLKTYGIEISSIQATIGPTVTLYEIIPAPGVRIAKIKNLEDDIALSLAALGIRIIAPIPGKGTVGIEVPNNDPQTVSMRSIIASRKFQESRYELPIALGKTITNEVYISDLTKMPHVLVAGATGQGKSVGLNAVITSLLYKKHPAELKFVLIDPKKVEFSIYSIIERHFLAKLPDTDKPIITDTSKVVQTLQSVTREMDMRYSLLESANVRTIKEYNAKFKSRHLLPSHGHRFLPYIVVIIDEFSDLIMTAGKEVEGPIIRIAQLARAVGIHMIIATQRPSTNVITGIIKANFPARIAFRVQSMIDSRTILDCPGANQLIGRGDMLIAQNSEMTRVQCAFVDTPEVEKICQYISTQQSYPDAFLLPEYIGEEVDGKMDNSFDTKDRDPLFEEAARIIVSSQQATTSSLQRRYSIGYNRAGRLMDQLEAAGIVSPATGGRPREVLIIDLIQLENKLSQMK